MVHPVFLWHLDLASQPPVEAHSPRHMCNTVHIRSYNVKSHWKDGGCNFTHEKRLESLTCYLTKSSTAASVIFLLIPFHDFCNLYVCLTSNGSRGSPDGGAPGWGTLFVGDNLGQTPDAPNQPPSMLFFSPISVTLILHNKVSNLVSSQIEQCPLRVSTLTSVLFSG